MKIALPSRNNQIDDHFGHCQFFTVYTIDENKNITGEHRLDPPQGCGCKSDVAEQLAAMGVTIMLAGNMGQGAVNKLAGQGIQVVRGCTGGLRENALAWLAGKISDSGQGCKAHEHGHDCGHDHDEAHSPAQEFTFAKS